MTAPKLKSKLPDVETTIFTVVSRRAAEVGALNIGQGFPDYPIDPELAECVGRAMNAGRNQYAPMEGVLELREAIAAKLLLTQSVTIDARSEITITCGGTEALFSAMTALLGPGDNAIVFDPAYDAYEPAIRLAGASCRRIALSPPHFRLDWAALERAMDAHTRLIVLNNPHNPACTTVTQADLQRLAELLRERDCYVLADEVYEHVVFDGNKHCSVLALPELRERSLAVFSFGKTLHATGWRIGYLVAPPELTREFRKVHQFNTFSIATPLQFGIASFLDKRADAWRGLAEFFQRKRDLLRDALAGTAYRLPPAQGTYFQLLDFSAICDLNDIDCAEALIREVKLAPIPLSPFYRERPRLQLLRLCIAKENSTLIEAATRLRRFAELQAGRS
jgi:methionine aminotransferase